LRFYNGWLLIVGVALFIPMVGWGADQKTTTVITSNTMTASSRNNQAIFRDNVKMVQEELVVHSDIMIVYFKEKGSSPPVGQLPSQNSKKEIRVIEAKGNVKISKGESRATCQRAIYDKQGERIVLLESPVVWQAGTRVSGRKITMFLKENRSVVEGETRVIIEETEKDEGVFAQ
jgi:lipopolysaccharide export system protein LptA